MFDIPTTKSKGFVALNFFIKGMFGVTLPFFPNLRGFGYPGGDFDEGCNLCKGLDWLTSD
jgi:hypothetical protein